MRQLVILVFSFLIIISVIFLDEKSILANKSLEKNNLISYQSTYEVELGDSKINPQIGKSYVTRASGELFIDWINNCDSWVSNQRMLTRFVNAYGVGTVNEINYSLVESNSGSDLRFSLEVKENAELIERTFGTGKKKNDLIVEFQIPDKKNITFPNDVIFPHQFLIEVIENMFGKKKMVSKKVYEGTIIDKYFNISVFYTNEVIEESKELLPEGVTNKFEKIRMAYYQDNNDVPFMELTAHLNNQGIVSYFEYDYPQYSLIMRLKKINLPNIGCESN